MVRCMTTETAQIARHTHRMSLSSRFGSVAVVAALFLSGCAATDEQEEPTQLSDRQVRRAISMNPGEKSEQRQAQTEQQCMRQALEETRTGSVRCGEQEVVVCSEDGTFEVTDAEGYYNVVCEGDEFVGLAWDSDVNHFFSRVRFMGRWIGKAVPAGQGTRLARPSPPPPPPAPAPPAPIPDAPSSDDDGGSGGLVYTTDDDHGYTGPRCYEPDGYTFVPC